MLDEMQTSNSPRAIQQRIQAGRIGWAGPLILTTARTGLILLVQAVVATAWWTVYATLVDIGCLLLLSRQARREGIGLVDLFGIERSQLGREILWGLLYFVVLFPIVAGFGSKFASWLVYGTTQLTPHMLAPGLLSERQLPHWAVIYSLSVFWLVWSPTEEVIYQAYCAARLQVLTGSTWVTVNAGRFLVGVPTQRVPSGVQLAFDRISLLAISVTGRGLSTRLSADAPPSSDDHHALANGFVRGSADPQAVTSSGSQEC
jgi:hypothetical protein